jgi:hypothetical protein
VIHYNLGETMKNVTITMEEEILRWARITAAEKDTSVSRLVGEMLKDKMEKDSASIELVNGTSAVIPPLFRKMGEKLPAREDLHER